ncbi:MAG: signal peptide peptidase SppA [Campylobacter sp.]
MEILKTIFVSIGAIFKFINNYFKTLIFLLILFAIFGNKDVKTPNLTRIDITGEIMDSAQILEQIYAAIEDENIKGVMLYIDSPGGALAPSIELAMAVNRLKAKKKVLAYAAGNMTSGSYYAGIWADKIIANKGAFIGSIGVIMQGINISELAQKVGISEQIIKAGDFKEAGTFTRAWSKNEKEQLQNLINKSYEMFVKDVATARNLSLDQSSNWANARIFLANEALQNHLIDELGDYYEAKKQTQLISGVKEPVWQEMPFFEKFLQNQVKNGVQSLVSAFISFKVR